MSNTEQAVVSGMEAPQSGPAPGERLRAAREARGESSAEVAYALKLSQRQIEALESGDYDALPGPAFVRGFMRNYARHLGLDPELLLGSLAEVVVARPVDLAPLSNAQGDLPVGRSGRSATGPAAVVAVALMLMVALGWYFDWFRTEPLPPAADETALGSDAQPVRGDVAVEPVSPPAAAEVPAAPATPAAAAPVAPAPEPVVPAAAPAAPSAAVAAAAPAVPPVPAATAPATDAGAGPQLVFQFSGESWIEVRDASGTVVYSGVGAAGSTRVVRGRAPLALVVGNAAGVRLEYDGREVDLKPHTRVTVARLTVQ